MKKAFIYIILAGILWGSSGIFVHYLAPMGLSSANITTVRSVVGVICMAVYLLLTDKKAFIAKPKQIALYIGSGIGFFFTGTCYFASMQMTSVSTAVVLMYTAPVFVMMYSVAFLGEKLTAIKTISVAAMLIGCALVSGIIGGFKFDLMGIFVGLMAGVAYSSYNILTKIQMKNKCNPYSATLYCFVFTALTSLIFSKPGEILHVVAQNPKSLILITVCGICTCVLPYLFFTLSLKDLPAGTASSLAIVEPLAATLLSVAFLGEKLTIYSFAGIILIVSAIFALGKSKEK